MSTLSVDTITGQTTAANVKMPKGHIIQLEQNTNLAVLQSNGTALTNVLSLAITPKYNTSKILVQVSGQLANSTAGQASFLYLKRGTTEIAKSTTGSTANYRAAAFYCQGSTHESNGFAVNFLDSPATTSATTYNIELAATGGTAFLGRRGDGNDGGTCPTFLTLMEIAQ